MNTVSSHVCPLNNRPCRCDPNAGDKKFQPCKLTKHIGQIFGLMLGSNSDCESANAASALRRLVESEGVSVSDLTTIIENCDGRIEERKYSDADVEIIFKRGKERGRAEEATKQQAPPEFYDADGHPRWSEVALFCQRNIGRLRDEREKEFVNDMTGKLTWREPTERQSRWLFSIFVKLGGKYDPKAIRFHW